ncbi:sugar ABC transporter permease [Pantoea vagans]|uniref:carbohydrate ABC transporter permease n=1 Tax=Pantoea vagans TaxID=470934 RepID=UPI003017639F
MINTKDSPQRGKAAFLRELPASLALIPMFLTVVVVFVGCLVWTIILSFTSSKLMPVMRFVGFEQFMTLANNTRFITSYVNLFIFGGLFIVGCLVFGFLLAVFIDQKVKGEGLFRTIFLMPHAMSFIVTGIAWQWMLNPELGIQKLFHDIGLVSIHIDWLTSQRMAIYTVVIAGIWQSAGLAMIILLAGLRGVDADIWKASRIDGVSTPRYYFSIVLPLITPAIVTATVLLSAAVFKLYDLVVAMTKGGPGIATEVPAKFIMDTMFERANVGLAAAAAVVLLITLAAILAPVVYARRAMRTFS